MYDLPDAYLVAGQLGALVANIMGNKMTPADFAPYYHREAVVRADRKAAVGASKDFIRSVVKPKRKPNVPAK